MIQKIFSGDNLYDRIPEILAEHGCKSFMLVCGSSFKKTDAYAFICNMGIPYTVFSAFTPNPDFSEVWDGIDAFNSVGADTIIAAGGGSAMDVAKAIKMFYKTDRNTDYLKKPLPITDVPLLAIPTTAGTGSESTRFAVVYDNGVKQSVADASIIPNYAFLDHRFLKSLPAYQKKCTLLDALCQAIESWWSVNSDDESKEYSERAIKTMLKHYKAYVFDNSSEAAKEIMLASNYAGRAINITQTTAAHAMSYKLTTVYGIPHGHAVAVCLPNLWRFMVENPEKCNDDRGAEYLQQTFKDIAVALGEKSAFDGIERFEKLLSELEILPPQIKNDEVTMLAESVNTERLANNPAKLTKQDLCFLYKTLIGAE